ncbi:MAG: glutaredoxin 3 [Magnetovibrio sp.]|nr:glutaredoxin 3 [Magnetovibrio sp.]
MAKIEIYTSPFCGFCHRAKTLLAAKGVEFEEIDTFMASDKRAEMSARAGGRTSVPQVFVDGAHLGDSDELQAMEAEGVLDAKLGLA